MSAAIPLRVIVAHCAYQMRGGEDSVVEAERELLRSRGHEVLLYQRRNDDIQGLNKLVAASQALWSGRTYRQIIDLALRFKADIIHAHNTFPLISPSLYGAAWRCRIPVVQTLHNFRLLCPQGVFLRAGALCEDCLGHIPWRGVVHRCYRASAAQTSVAVGMLAAHRWLGTYQRKVTRYIALNEFARGKFIEGGFPADRISIKPNFVDIPPPAAQCRRGGLFVGRLSPEKGVSVMMEALRRHPQISLDVMGAGPLHSTVVQHPQLRVSGWCEPREVYERMRGASYLLLPSVCYENFPRTLVEAFACGLPVIASRSGPMMELIEEGHSGLLFESGSASDLADKIAWAEAHPEAMRRMGDNARHAYEAKFTPEENYRQLTEIYRGAMEESRQEQVRWAMQG